MSRRPPILSPAILVIPGLLAAAACDKESPAAPTAAPTAVEAVMAIADNSRKASPLAIQDMLDDPLFRATIEDISESSLEAPLTASVKALEAGQIGLARSLIAKASVAAGALGKKKDVDAMSLMLWSVIERYLEAAELL